MNEATVQAEPVVDPPRSSVQTITIRMPELHEHQWVFMDWEENHPEAQVLVAPCGTKLGKSFGASVWLLTKALVNAGTYCVWIAPTYMKARIGYRYMKAMLPDVDIIDCKDGRLEIWLGNGSFIKFLHGKDAEVTVEGEAIDWFVVDEAGKMARQLWYSLFTTITQTLGKGIVTGTPRGFNVYHELYKLACGGDPFFTHVNLPTWVSPYVSKRAIEQAKRILPKALFDQYYGGRFVSMSTVFGDLSLVWDESFKVGPRTALWLHPDPKKRALDIVVGADWAKKKDRTVFLAVASTGETVGYWRFRGGSYITQVKRLAQFCAKFKGGDVALRYDSTGVGEAVGDVIAETFDKAELDVSVTAVTFTNSSKQEMVTRTTIAVERGWWRCPRLDAVEQEFSAYELKVTRSGLYTYSAPDGEHDDVVSAGLLAISGAYASAMADEAQSVVETAIGGSQQDRDDPIAAYAALAADTGEDDEDAFDELDEPDTDDDAAWDEAFEDA